MHVNHEMFINNIGTVNIDGIKVDAKYFMDGYNQHTIHHIITNWNMSNVDKSKIAILKLTDTFLKWWNDEHIKWLYIKYSFLYFYI